MPLSEGTAPLDTPPSFTSRLPVWRRLSASMFLLRVIAAATVLLLWEILVIGFRTPDYVLPRPSAVISAAHESAALVLRHSLITLGEALGGLICAVLIAISLALLLHMFPFWGKLVEPFIAGFQAFPKEAIAPLLIIWFGFGLTSKIVMAASIAFFPIFVSMCKGLVSVPDEIIQTFAALRATRIQVLWSIRIPFALPYLTSGVRVGATLSLVGAVIAEFVGASAGLGHFILVANSQFAVDLVFVALAALAIMGLALDASIRSLERVLIPWHDSISGIH